VKKDILRLGIALALFAAGACAALAVVYTVTEPTIAGLEREQLKASLQDLFPDADSFDAIEGGLESSVPGVTVTGAWKAGRGDATLGVAIKASASSYGGDAVMLVGVSTDRRIAGARVMTLSDTPGLGANAVNPAYFVDKTAKKTFPGQFAGKLINDAFEVKNDVVAISASTITSKALTSIVKEAGLVGSAWLEGNASGGTR
jgi:electron transport complex protein RnfG